MRVAAQIPPALGCLAAVSALAGGGTAAVAGGVLLRHQMTPGTVTTYRLRIETAHRSAAGERKTVESGRLTRVIFHEDEPGKATCAQMLELDPATPAGDDAQTQPEPGEPTRKAASSPDWVQLSIARVRLDRAPLILPGRTTWTRQVLSAVVGVTDWPSESVSIGDRWERSLPTGPVKGTQRYQLEAIERAGTDVRARLTVSTAVVPPAGSPSRRLVSAGSTVHWSVGDRELLSLDGRAVTRERDRSGACEVTRRIVMTRDRRHRMSQRRQETEREAVIQLGQAVSAYQREDYSYAERTLRVFRRRWPNSRWAPLVEYIRRRIRAERASREPLPADELKTALTKLLALWYQAEQDDDAEVLQRCRSSLAHLAKVNRPEIVRLLDDRQAPLRSLACFALAFGSAPADMALIQTACEDPEVRVRRTALYALTVRASPLTDAQVLLKALGDEDAAVRERACDAVGACVADDSPHLAAARAALVDRLADASSGVVLAAARALMQIGSAGEIEKVKQAAEKAPSGALRDALRGIVEASGRHSP